MASDSDTASVDVLIYGDVDLAQDDEFLADGFVPFPQPIGNVLGNDAPGVTIVSADGREMVDSIDIFVTEEFGLGLGVITIESNGDVTFTVFEPFFDVPITTKTFWYTVSDGLSTEAALVTVDIFGGF